MDVGNHAVQGFFIGYIPFSWNTKIGITIGILCAIISTIPDLYGEYMARIKKDGYVWYDSAHRGEINKKMKWVIPWSLHTFLDSLGHDEGERWYVGKWYEYFMVWKWKEGMWMESLSWLLNATLFLLFFVC